MTGKSHSVPPGKGDGARTTHFGFRDVEAADKPRLVRDVFESVAGRYDLMNDLMSGGVHRIWKAAFIDWLAPRPGLRLLDVAGGTGDVALSALRRIEKAGESTVRDRAGRITVCDYTYDMLRVGRERALDRGVLDQIDWVRGDAQDLPFAARSWDAYTIAFGLRNVTDIDRALAEAYRVLTPGGRFLCLEFSHVALPVLDRLYDLYSFEVLPALGELVTGDRDAYSYLVQSIRRFPEQDALAKQLEDAGFSCVRWRNLTGGIAAIHSGWRV
jgi:demethylmenaquinone methyltransferase/2-methoxy-6-polyprenyl-1,4-benzoquinol methylase